MRPFCCFFLPFTTKRPMSSCATVPPLPLLRCNATVMARVAARALGQLVIVYHRMHSQPECWTPLKAESRAQIFPRRDNLQKNKCLLFKAGLTCRKLEYRLQVVILLKILTCCCTSALKMPFDLQLKITIHL